MSAGSRSICWALSISLGFLGLCGAEETTADDATKDVANQAAIKKSIKLYASFDEKIAADIAGGARDVQTRSDDPANKGEYVVKPGFPARAFSIQRNAGVVGGALAATDVLPNRGRLFFKAAGNTGYRSGGWSGTASCWLKTNPDKLLKTKFCDPIQITQRGASNGGLWIDFPDGSPRKLRLGAFKALGAGEKAIQESASEAPLIVVPKIGFRQEDWHHVAMTWSHFDSMAANAKATLYIDGQKIGSIEDRDIAMNWNETEAGIYFAVNYIGLMDELAILDRELTADEIEYLHRHPASLSAKRK